MLAVLWATSHSGNAAVLAFYDFATAAPFTSTDGDLHSIADTGSRLDIFQGNSARPSACPRRNGL